jgi:glycosyltransferase involved in cell wall biosynthesis
VIRISVVIITKNEERNIVGCIQSAKLLTDDIIIVDSGSTDATVQLAKQQGAKLIVVDWKGYGTSKNKGASLAKNDWIFALDADERITPQLVRSIKNLNFDDHNFVYQFERANYLGNKKIKFGTDGFDKVIRIYHRRQAQWDLTPVHEKLTGKYIKNKIPGHLIHYSTKSWEDYKEKLFYYAKLSADKYYEQGKRATLLKRCIAPVFNSLKSYIFQLGFLDGKTGFRLAVLMAYYTWLKYHYLYQFLNKQKMGSVEMNGFKTHEPLANSTIAFSRK